MIFKVTWRGWLGIPRARIYRDQLAAQLVVKRLMHQGKRPKMSRLYPQKTLRRKA
jgi:hypothetical protein